MRSRWTERARVRRAALAACVAAASLAPGRAVAQDEDVEAACRSPLPPWSLTECRFAFAAAEVIQPRLGAALFGGNPVPGTASTLGMRIGSLPRMSLAFRVTGAPAELPPIRDRTVAEGDRTLPIGFTADASVGVLTGFSPLPTVGGVLSLDLIARAGYLPLSTGGGFHDDAAWGWAVGARVGALRESFTLPGIAVTGTYGRISRTAFGDPDTGTTDGFFEGAVTDLRAGLAATKRVGLVGVTGGVAYDRYSSHATVGFADVPGGPQTVVEGDVVHGRWSGYVNTSWTMLIFHVAAEAGWQEAPVPAGIPAGVDVDPVGWFAGASFRVSL